MSVREGFHTQQENKVVGSPSEGSFATEDLGEEALTDVKSWGKCQHLFCFLIGRNNVCTLMLKEEDGLEKLTTWKHW